ncbi:MAG: hypothetical protein WD871_06055 [Xanthobacteraceae bacterium]
MAIGEYTAILSHRYSGYALVLVALTLVAGFLYAFNFTTSFGALTQ